jgi:hypothetical protein
VTFFDAAVTHRITAEARQRDFRRTAAVVLRATLTAVAAVLYGLGWTVAKTLAGVWFVAAWCGTAVKVGWQEARATDRT